MSLPNARNENQLQLRSRKVKMDSHNYRIEPIEPIFRPRVVPSVVGRVQTNRRETISLILARPIVQAPSIVHPVRITKTMPTLRVSQSFRMSNVVATPPYQLGRDNRVRPVNNAVTRRTMSSTQVLPLPIYGQRNNDGTVRIGTIPITTPANRPVQSTDISTGKYPHFPNEKF